MLRLLISLVFLGLLSSLPAYAQDEAEVPVQGDFAILKRIGSAQVETVVDALTLTLKDGRVVRLAELDIPAFVYPEPGPFSLKAKEMLEALFKEHPKVTLYQTQNPKTGRVNRMGHVMAHLETDDGIWVQGELVALGLARAAPTLTNFQMMDQLKEIEAQAIAQKAGLWAEDAHPLLGADNAALADGQFAVVEGVVQNAASVKNNVYLNFGSDWRQDFTVMIEPAVRKQLVRAGIDPLALNGQTVRVRGWVREYNGPLIELNHPAALSVLPKEALKDAL